MGINIIALFSVIQHHFPTNFVKYRFTVLLSVMTNTKVLIDSSIILRTIRINLYSYPKHYVLQSKFGVSIAF